MMGKHNASDRAGMVSVSVARTWVACHCCHRCSLCCEALLEFPGKEGIAQLAFTLVETAAAAEATATMVCYTVQQPRLRGKQQ